MEVQNSEKEKKHKLIGLSHKCEGNIGNYQGMSRDVVRDQKQAMNPKTWTKPQIKCYSEQSYPLFVMKKSK